MSATGWGGGCCWGACAVSGASRSASARSAVEGGVNLPEICFMVEDSVVNDQGRWLCWSDCNTRHAAAGVRSLAPAATQRRCRLRLFIIIEAVVHAEGAMHAPVQAWAKLRACCMSWPWARRARRRLWWPTRAHRTIASHPARLPAAIHGAGAYRFGTLAFAAPLVSCSAMVFRPEASCPITLGNNGAHR